MMTHNVLNYIKKASLCALLLTDFNAIKPKQATNEITLLSQVSIPNSIITRYPENHNTANARIKINSITNLIVNKSGDTITFNGIARALHNKVEYNEIKYNLFEEYAKSESELLIISGHHYTGKIYFFDNRKKVFMLDKLPENEHTKILIMRGCHTVMNPIFLYEEAKEHYLLSCTAEEFIKVVTKFAPDIELIIGYETKSPRTKDDALIKIIQNFDITEKKGIQNYGEYVLDVTKKMFKEPGTEKYIEEDKTYWTYNTHYHPTLNEGVRLAYYMKENNQWKYYSLDNREGIYAKY